MHLIVLLITYHVWFYDSFTIYRLLLYCDLTVIKGQALHACVISVEFEYFYPIILGCLVWWLFGASFPLNFTPPPPNIDNL